MNSSTTTLLRASRPLFRTTPRQTAPRFFSQNSTSSSTFRTAFQRSRFNKSQSNKRWQSTSSASASAQQSWFKRMWDSPIGLKTVHFWAPVMKWALVLAGVSDFYRPAEKLSLTQNAALTCTGLIWTRWCLIIKPRNILLATVNFFLGMVGIVQVSRILAYQYSDEGKAAAAKLKAEAIEAEKKVEGAIKS